MKIVKLRIALVDGGFRYDAEAIDDCGRYYYRVGQRTIEISKNEYDRVIANPRLYYFSTALKLHKSIEKGLGKYVGLSESSDSHEMVADQDKVRWSRLLEQTQSPQPQGGADVEDCTFLETAPEIDRLLTWGILNPLGPTVNSLCLVADPTGNTEVIFVKTSNPFTQSTIAYGTVPAGGSEDEVIEGVINAICPVAEESPAILRDAPTFVILPTDGRIQALHAFALVYRTLIVGSKIDLSFEIDRFKRFWLNPWERIPSMAEMLAPKPRQPDSVWWENRKQIFGEWWPLVTDPDHVIAEWRAIVEAWQGAIEFQGDSPMAKIAIPAEEALAFHTRLLGQEKA